jgi:hypothetical protein
MLKFILEKIGYVVIGDKVYTPSNYAKIKENPNIEDMDIKDLANDTKKRDNDIEENTWKSLFR